MEDGVGYLLYYNPDSANIVIRMALEELGAAYRDELVPRSREERSEAFHRLNPRGLLPVLIEEDTDTAMFETAAILAYLVEAHGRLGPPPGPTADRARFLKWLFFLSNTLHADLRIRFYTRRFVGEDSEVPTVMSTLAKRISAHLQLIDREIGEHGGTTLLPGGLTVCDFYLGCCVRWAQLYPRDSALDGDLLARLPNLAAALAALQDRPSVARAMHREDLPGPAFIAPEHALPPRDG